MISTWILGTGMSGWRLSVVRLSVVRLSVVRLSVLIVALLAPSARATASDTAPSGPVPAATRFEEIGRQAGVRILHSTRDFGERRKAQVLEMFTEGGAAAAVGDFDNDGFDDLFVIDSGEGERHHLMRNNGLRNNGPGADGVVSFTDVTARAGVGGGNDARSICADALWLDYDNDGLLDLLVGRFGTPILYRNQGPGKDGMYAFADVSAKAGLTKFGNTLAMIAFDHDNDGWLDLLLGNYFQPLNLLDLESRNVMPNNLDYADNGGGVTFWRNIALDGGGRGFVEITQEAGFSHHTGWSLDLGHADLNNDGLQDVYIAGDYGTDRLFVNQGASVVGTLSEGGASAAYSFKDVTEEAMGFDTRKGMNVDMGDYDRDGFLDVYVTNITDEYMKECNFLWHNEGVDEHGSITLIDLSRETGTCDTDWGWAAKFGDFDNDGWQDIFAVNGLRSRGEQNYIPILLEMIITPGIDFSSVDSYPDIGDMTWSGYQKQRFFRNLGDGTFKESAAEAGLDNDLDGRGIAMGDFDNDGLLDLYQTNANQPALLHHNRTRGAGSWLEIKLSGTASNRDAIGARVTVSAGGESYMREVNCGNAYASQSTTRLHFGLGAAKRVDAVEIRWPSGLVEKLAARDGQPAVEINAISKIREGEGVAR